MKNINFNSEINNILNTFENIHSELFTKLQSKNELIDSDYLSEFINRIKENIDELNELKTFKSFSNCLLTDLTRIIFQVDRLSEENQWLNEELFNLNKNISLVDETILSKKSELLKTKYLYEMKLIKYENDDLSNKNDFDLIEIENIFCESQLYEKKVEISKNMIDLSETIRDYISEGKIDMAILLCNQSIHDLKQKDDKHPDIATLLCMLGFLYKDMLKWNDAANCILEALKLREQYYGLDSDIVASTLNNLAIVLAANEKFEEAESLSRKALEIKERIYGSNHESVAKQMNNLGLLLINLEMFCEGEILFNKAMNVYLNLEKAELYYLKTSTNLANMYVKRKEYEKAENQLKHNLEIIYKHRFNNNVKNVIKMYLEKPTLKTEVKTQSCLLFDKYLIPEIVNIKFLIQVYEKESNFHLALKCKECLNFVLPNLNDSEYNETDKLSVLFGSEIPMKSKVLFFFNKLTKLINFL